MISLSSELNEESDMKTPSSNNSTVLDVPSPTSSVEMETNNDFIINSNGSTSVEGSVVASPSVESFSTFPDLEASESQHFDSHDLQVKVNNPQKHVETLETYITFQVTTKTSRSEFVQNEYVVRRRYNDFNWLRLRLIEAYPTHIIPPMPGKHSFLAQLDRYSREFIIARMKLLNVFLNRIVSHPILSCDKNLNAFLTTTPKEFIAYRVNRGNCVTKSSDVFTSASNSNSNSKLPHQEFEQIRDYCISLSEKLNATDKINKRIYKERQDFMNELHQLHLIFTQLSNSEPELSKLMQAFAEAVEINAAAHQKLLHTSTNEEREYIAYCDAVREALIRRDSIQSEFEAASEELSKRRSEKDELNENGAENNERWESSFWKTETSSEKIERLSQSIVRLTKVVEILQDRLQCANENLRSDLERWNIEKEKDLKHMLIAMADQQIKHFQQTSNGWEEALSNIKMDNADPIR